MSGVVHDVLTGLLVTKLAAWLDAFDEGKAVAALCWLGAILKKYKECLFSKLSKCGL
jgi:hypothetical protein